MEGSRAVPLLFGRRGHDWCRRTRGKASFRAGYIRIAKASDIKNAALPGGVIQTGETKLSPSASRVSTTTSAGGVSTTAAIGTRVTAAAITR
jgi:hypothetical protein